MALDTKKFKLVSLENTIKNYKKLGNSINSNLTLLRNNSLKNDSLSHIYHEQHSLIDTNDLSLYFNIPKTVVVFNVEKIDASEGFSLEEKLITETKIDLGDNLKKSKLNLGVSKYTDDEVLVERSDSTKLGDFIGLKEDVLYQIPMKSLVSEDVYASLLWFTYNGHNVVLQEEFDSKDAFVEGMNNFPLYFNKNDLTDYLREMPHFRRFEKNYHDLESSLTEEITNLASTGKLNKETLPVDKLFDAYRIMSYMVDVLDISTRPANPRRILLG